MIAYLRGIGGDGSDVVLTDIANRSSMTFCDDGHKNIMGLALSHELLVYANFEGILYVVDLAKSWDRSQPAQVRLPSADILSMAVDGRSAAVLLSNSDTRSSVLLYDHSSRHTTSFTIEDQLDKQRPTDSIAAQALLLDGNKQTLDVFGSVLSTYEGNAEDSTDWDSDGDPSLTTCVVGHMRSPLREISFAHRQ